MKPEEFYKELEKNNLQLTELQKNFADVNDDGLINTHDGLAMIKDLQGNDVYDEKSEVLLLIQRYMANMKCEPSTFRDKFYDKVIYSSDITEDFLDKLCVGSI